MRFLAETAASFAGTASRLLGRGGGTSLPGVVLLRLRPNAPAELAGDLTSGTATISATNGKTTTARLIRSAIDTAGIPAVANTAGANLLGGVTSALLAARNDRPAPHVGIFEVDEAALPAVVDQLAPRVVVLMNLFRDQLDRYGEIATLIDNWEQLVTRLPPSTTLVANADDPAFATFADHHDNICWFGLGDTAVMGTALSHAADSTRCRRCTTELEYAAVSIGHLGHWHCPNCGLSRPTPHVVLTSVAADGIDQQHLTVEVTGDGQPAVLDIDLGLPGLHNAYNALAAVASLDQLGVDATAICTGLEATDAAFGRAERVAIDGRSLLLLLAKNPVGVNENIRTINSTVGGAEPSLHVLAMLNDRTADGRDVSWIWDVDYEQLLPHLDRLTISGDRAWDLALRFRYAGLDPDRMTVNPNPAAALDEAVAQCPANGDLFALATYTSMLDLRSVLTDRGLTEAFWEDT